MHLKPREHFIYEGSRIHPVQAEEYIRVLPPPSFIAQLDLVFIQLLKALVVATLMYQTGQ